MSCKINEGLSFVDCTDLEIGGVQGTVYIIDYDVWKRATITKDTNGEISNIVLTQTGDAAYPYVLTRGAPILTSPFTDNAGAKSGWTHSVQMFLPTKEQGTKSQLAGYSNFNRAVLIVILDASVVANVYGSDVGLKVTSYEELPNDPAKGGGIDVTFATPTDVTFENLPPSTVKDTDRATTIAMLEDLTTPVP